MRKRRNDFKTKPNGSEQWYDLREDWVLIESSIAKQYGIRLRTTRDISWSEFCTLVQGLMPDTPLGQIVGIRSEKDKNTIKQFTPEQRKIRNDWIRRQANEKLNDSSKLERDFEQLSSMFRKMFGNKKKGR